MALLRPLALAGVPLVLAACDLTRASKPVDTAAARPSVYSVLVTGDTTARVTLATAAPATDPSAAELLRPVSGAGVWLLTGGDSLALAEAAAAVPACLATPGMLPPDTAPAGPGCYGAAVPGGIRAGERYTLHIRFPDGSAVEGTAVPPAAPVLLAPAAGARVPDDSGGVYGSRGVRIDLRWSAGADVAAWWAALAIDAAFSADTVLANAQCSIQEPVWAAMGDPLEGTFVSSPAYCTQPSSDGIWQPVTWDSIPARLRLIVYDTAYARYMSQVIAGTVFERDAGVGIRGASGVFAAAASAEVPVVLVH